jgi:hypothetical protein
LTVTLLIEIREAMAAHGVDAEKAFALYKAHCNGNVPPRVPGIDTVSRLAVRIHAGRTIEEAAAREYLYRWELAIKPFDQCGGDSRNPACSIFGTPHTLGM